jgi:hypothetical protein
MGSISFVVPVLPGTEQAHREWMDALAGARREEYHSAWKNAGVTRHAVWQQQTANGTVDVVYLEADDGVSLRESGSSARSAACSAGPLPGPSCTANRRRPAA